MPAPVTPDRKSYHHGNLRQALVEATADLVQEQGPQAFTLTEAARAVRAAGAASVHAAVIASTVRRGRPSG